MQGDIFAGEAKAEWEGEKTNPGPFHQKVYGHPRLGHTPEQMKERDLLQANMTDEDYHRHSVEYAKRIRWCIDQGPEYWPAHDHKHCAPGDDTNFIFKIPPWHPDGTPNPLGIPDNRTVEAVPTGFELPVEYDSKMGWNCDKCHAWVPRHAHAYEGDPGALDWWWCLRCRQNKPKLSNAEKKNKAAAETTQNIQAMMKSKTVSG